MPVFRQLGDPLAGAVCLCQHHGAAYAERAATVLADTVNILRDNVDLNTAIVQVQITTTERCCIVVNAALVGENTNPVTDYEIERPIGTIRTTQEDEVTCDALRLYHYAAWEVLDPGTYTYYLMNRSGDTRRMYLAWIKAVASDCEA